MTVPHGRFARTLAGFSVALALGIATEVSKAETVSTLDGILAVTESVAPLGVPLSYVSGGDGLVGLADSWPVAGTPASAMGAYDHKWLQYDPAIIMTSGSTFLKQVFAIPGIDHGPNPQENLEFKIWGGTAAGGPWEEGTIVGIWRDGFDTAATTLGKSDDYTSLWGFSKGYNFFRITSGDRLTGGPFSPGEGEIDSLAAPIPEPSTYALMLAGLFAVGAIARRRGRR